MALIKAFLADETGATAIEYGLLASLIAMVLLGSFLVLATQVDDSFTELGEIYEDAQ
ncbi:Flp family type IVb pilin [Aurantiacibacter rhizosphaerae]|uniref:Flp family type IVb pilin n=1 Tax=Aurantiacibacter rhizosphaerae TaxID=2691582 RepID=A0A844XCJ3_9SPHN|nr:Flp family type IVb pilin [Aurantiacibacter rhizosphaerae]MWV28241.1 Flp family type IVb pilin [Aurantiacibacter rhizosphaerae]